jgi:hypothetical protein
VLKTRTAAIAAGTAAVLLAGAGAAAAAPRPGPGPQQVRAQTLVADRPDDGNGSPDPYWADDTFTRSLTITLTGGSAGDWTFTATVADTGTFTTIPREQTPDQGGRYAGEVIKSRVTGIMDGWADYSFTATELPSAAPNAGVTAYENDHGNVPSDSTSTWYELAFPAGTTFGGAGIGDWSWSYAAFTWPFFQVWVDAWDNGYGDLAGDGNIEG